MNTGLKMCFSHTGLAKLNFPFAGCDLDTVSEEISVAMVFASGGSSSGRWAGRTSCSSQTCAETLPSGSHIHQCLVPVRNCWTKQKSNWKKKSPCTQSSDRSGLSGDDGIIYTLWFNVPVSFFSYSCHLPTFCHCRLNEFTRKRK